MVKRIIGYLNSIRLTGSYIERLVKLLLAYSTAMFVILYVGAILEDTFINLIKGYSFNNPVTFISNATPYILYKHSYIAKLLCLLSGIPFLFLFIKFSIERLNEVKSIHSSGLRLIYLLAIPYGCVLLKQLTVFHKPITAWYACVLIFYLLVFGFTMLKKIESSKESV